LHQQVLLASVSDAAKDALLGSAQPLQPQPASTEAPPTSDAIGCRHLSAIFTKYWRLPG